MKGKWLSLILSVLSSTVFAGFQNDADAIIDKVSSSINIGAKVVDLTTGATLYQRNPTRTFIPASNMKLFSDAAALMALGPDYQFKTQLAVKASELSDGVLKGSLYLKLSGDPSFTHQQLAAMIARLKTWSLHAIEGNVYIDSSLARIKPYPPGWMSEDFVYSYGAPVAPLMLDMNRLLVTVNPAGKVGEPAIVELYDPSQNFTVHNAVKTAKPGSRCGVQFAMDGNNGLLLRGCVVQGQSAIREQMAIQNPLMYAEGLIKQELKNANIRLNGQIKLGKTPAGALLIANTHSKPVAHLLADTLKPSDNLYADSLFLHTAQQLRGENVDWADAQTLVKQFLQQETGIDLGNAVLTDGSGLSRYDLLTPNQTIDLLKFLYAKFPLSYEYIAALPVSGRDGTLQKRFKKTLQRDRVRAKTGTMRGVVSLSGYLYSANGHTIAFAFFINHKPGIKASVAGRYRYVVDALCDYFLQQKPEGQMAVFSTDAKRRLAFQDHPTQAEREHSQQAYWRHLEARIKTGLKEQAVTVIYRRNELILNDDLKTPSKVFELLKTLNKKHPLAAILSAKQKFPSQGNGPLIIWSQKNKTSKASKRVWTIYQAMA